MHSLKRRLAMLATTALVAICATFGWSATPASADLQPGVVLPTDGTIVTVNGPTLVGANYTLGRGPTACSADTRKSCVTIPVAFDAPLETVQAHELIFTITTRWAEKASTTVPAVGAASDDQVNTYIYTDPPKLGKGGASSTCGNKCEVDETDSFMAVSPTTLTIYRPQTNKFLITVENMYGANNGFTLELSVNDLSGGPGEDKSADLGAPVDYSDESNAAVTASYDDTAPASSSFGHAVTSSDLASAATIGTLQGSGPARGLTFDSIAARPDTDLDRVTGVDVRTLVDLGAARQIATVASSGPPASHPASGLALIISLVLVPGLLALVLFFIGRRRRGALTI